MSKEDWVKNTLPVLLGNAGLWPWDLRITTFLEGDAVRSYIDAFYDGREHLSYKLWMLFTIELWMREHDGEYSVN